VGGGIGYAAESLLGLAVPLGFLQFSRGFEADADYLGVEYMYKAGYDPQAFTSFFEKIQTQEKHKPGTIAKAFDTHPPTPDRISKTQDEIETLLPPRDEYRVDSSEFQEVKARLSEIENRLKIHSGSQDKPVLRRASNPSAADSGDSSSGDAADDRPTLKRRPSTDSQQNEPQQ
jgi:predicted Zn-dependent protease